MQATPISDSLSAIFAALSDPTRRAMLMRLSRGDASVNELAAPFKMSLPAVSKHIKVLERAGLLTKTVNAQQRTCKIDGAQLKRAVDWIDQYKQLWEGRLDRLDAYHLELPTSETAAKSSSEKVEKADKTTKFAKTTKKNTIKSIAKEAIHTSVSGKNSLKNHKINDKLTKSDKTTNKPKEKKDDDAPNNIQQQIGFDF